MSKRPEEYSRAQLIDLVSTLETQLNDAVGLDAAPDTEVATLITELKTSARNMEDQLVALYADMERRTDIETDATVTAALAEKDAQIATLQKVAAKHRDDAETIAGLRKSLVKAQDHVAAMRSEMAVKAGASAVNLASAMQAEALDQPIYVTLHNETFDMSDASGVHACREAVSRTMAETGIMLVKLLQHRQAQEQFRELTSVLPGGGHNTARMAQLGQAMGEASQRLTSTYVEGQDVSKLVNRLHQERGLVDQCIQALNVLDMDTRRNGKAD
ncbi:MAG: hypothetical protein H7338_09185 [Candidatus Sericytochromatia bacterium]|nr:hypothetical protein [Candidatus Sericytochromatia bacterium]